MTAEAESSAEGTRGDGGLFSLTLRALSALSDAAEVNCLTTDPGLSELGLTEAFKEIAHNQEVRNLSAEAPVVFVPAWDGERRGRGVGQEVLDVACECVDFPIAIILPASILVRLRRVAPTQFDSLKNRTAFVIERDAFSPKVHPALVVASWIIGPVPQKHVRMFSCVRKPPVEASAVESDFSRLLAMAGGATEYGYILRQGIPADAQNLSVFALDPKRDARKKELEGLGEIKPLATWYALAPVKSVDSKTQLSIAHDPNRRLLMRRRTIGASGIQRNGTIEPTIEATAGQARTPPAIELRANDLLVSKVAGASGLRVGTVQESDLPVAANSTVVALRPQDEIEPGLARFIRAFLRSNAALEMLRTRSFMNGDHILISPRELLELEVPFPDAGLQAAIADVDQATAQMVAWLVGADQVLAAAFDEDSILGARRSILTRSLELRDRVQLAAALDDPDRWLQHTAPLPIAFRWRTVAAMMQTDQAEALLKAVLGSFESSLGYFAQLAIVMARLNGLEIGAARKIKSKLASRREGTTIGDWVAILTEVAEAKGFRKLPEFAPLGEVREVLEPAAASAAAVEQLKRIRNDYAHDRNAASSSERLSIALEAAALQREFLLHACKATGDLALNYVRRSSWDSISGASRAEVSVLKGDHWVVTPRQVQYSEPLEEGSLYIRDNNEQLHLMRPLLFGFECPECHTFSTFYIDANFRGQLTLKVLRNQSGSVGSDPCRLVILPDQSMVEK